MGTATQKCRVWLRRLTALLWIVSASSHASLNGAQITQSAMGCTDCIDWKISGMCYWLRCSWLGCSVETSMRVSHWIPDVVVSSYSGGESPWSETQSWNSDEPTVIAHQSSNQGDTHADFKKVDVIGHPATLVFEALNATGYFATSAATAYMPYFISDFDRLGWASGIPEMFSLEALSGRRVVGSALVRFGTVYPRTGWSVHAEDPKSAALTAQRAADLVTSRERAARVYQPIGTDCGNKCWAPPPVRENDSSTHRWQRLTPVPQNNDWEIFGQSSGWANGKYDGSEQYAWALWRPYSYCEPQGAFLGSAQW